MANVNSPFGLRAIGTKGADPSVPLHEYTINTAYATKIYKGDVVEMTGTGQDIAKAPVGNTDSIGVFAGCEYVTAKGEVVMSPNWDIPSSARNIKAFVYDDPNTIFIAQADTLAATDVGALVAWNAGTGNDLTGQSGVYADIGAGTATSGKALRIRRLYPDPDNSYGQYAKVEIEFSQHALAPGAGVGV